MQRKNYKPRAEKVRDHLGVKYGTEKRNNTPPQGGGRPCHWVLQGPTPRMLYVGPGRGLKTYSPPYRGVGHITTSGKKELLLEAGVVTKKQIRRLVETGRKVPGEGTFGVGQKGVRGGFYCLGVTRKGNNSENRRPGGQRLYGTINSPDLKGK